MARYIIGLSTQVSTLELFIALELRSASVFAEVNFPTQRQAVRHAITNGRKLKLIADKVPVIRPGASSGCGI
jgi:hypothetical protein